jgi:hypothetical protein
MFVAAQLRARKSLGEHVVRPMLSALRAVYKDETAGDFVCCIT